MLWATVSIAAPLQMTKVADGVYVHVGKHLDFDTDYDGDIANIGFVVGHDSVAIIDTGGSYKVGAALREAVKKVTSLPIRYVINTHIHPDHIFGNAAFVQDKPEFIGHSKLPATMELNAESLVKTLQKELGPDAKGSEIVLPTRIVESSLTLDLGQRILKLQAWPKAHTSTDLTVLDEQTKTAWLGDLLFITRTPSLDGDLKGWIAVLDSLKQIDAQVAIPGHGEPTQAKNQMLDAQGRYLHALLDGVRDAIQHGVDLMQATNTVAQAEKSHWVLFDVVNPRNVNLAYPQLEWE